ncbi:MULTISPECIES: YbjO family protein [unclassified Brenneria]|uniref:YbjO family protein n=1 Tax=unclassified Brenneria TaxID=2634434 RepID=UPI001553141D|nr:YbjO family protein [Brenneria sp. L3-3C-1]MEE3641734.1 YbjO family protein [Brenneria sp. L3_3C_1]MEE3649636.1 YbjO family protein [Brenneria sp. HEZEL_4_2_4]NPC99594.1 YbjO family protein [Brenneria sp. hezel4-2-4]
MTLQKAYAPVPVMVAGIAIIATRFLGVLLLVWELGLSGLGDWIGSSAQSWDSTLIFLLSLVVVCAEVRCGFAVLTGANWGRWGYVICQCLVVPYMLLASVSDYFPAIFHITGDDHVAVLHQLLLQKIPDLLVIVLLFLPRRSRRFFTRLIHETRPVGRRTRR